MTLSSLRPPGPLVAYLSEAAPEALAEYLVAFANTDGGTIVVGLDDKGRPVGRSRRMNSRLMACGRASACADARSL